MSAPKVLVIDDNPTFREMVGDILQAADFKIETAENGQEGLDRFYGSPDFNVIVSDIHMPVMDGIELIQALRNDGWDVPVIVLSGQNESALTAQALKSGASEYFIKDNGIVNDLVPAVLRVIEQKRIADQNRQTIINTAKANLELEQIVDSLTEVGMALSSEKDFPKLLERIVTNTRAITGADAGTLYLLEDNLLHFKVVQNDTLKTYMGGASGKPITFPPVELKVSNVSAAAALSGRTVNIDDVYASEQFDFTGPKKFDAVTGYRSRSMLVVPMKNHEGDVVGVLQLLNARHPTSKVAISFSRRSERLAESIASQAAVAINKLALIDSMERLFEAFVEVMAAAIDEKSPVTSGHIKRVANLTLTMAEAINEESAGRFGPISFSEDQMRELKLAALMHDIGKVTTPVEVVEKGKKLQTIFDRVHYVDLRFRYLRMLAEKEALALKLQLVMAGAAEEELRKLDAEAQARFNELEVMRAFIVRCNEPGEFLENDKVDRLKAIAQKTYTDEEGRECPYLTPDELENLSIRKGSITEKERKIMQHHATVTVRMLEKIPFTRKLKNIPTYAGAHHEFINGKGYPLGLKGDAIPFPGKVMAVTDIVEALTATDRPYKKAMPLSNVYRIMRSMAAAGELDSELVELFITKDIYGRYLAKYEPGRQIPAE